MGIFMESLPESSRERLQEEISNPEPEDCDHQKDQYVTKGQRMCNSCNTQIERDGNGGFRKYTDGRHDEAYNTGDKK